MLQQTQVARVVPRYLAWLERWPSVESLAAATPADVIREWQGLGYNRRALNLHRAARRDRGGGLARRPDRASRSRSLHSRRRGSVRLRPARAAGRHERPPCARPDRRRVRARLGSCAHGPRRHGLPRADPPLRRVSTRERVSVTRPALRAAPKARPLRRLVPPAPRPDADPRRRETSQRQPRLAGGRRAGGRRARSGPPRPRQAARLTNPRPAYLRIHQCISRGADIHPSVRPSAISSSRRSPTRGRLGGGCTIQTLGST